MLKVLMKFLLWTSLAAGCLGSVFVPPSLALPQADENGDYGQRDRAYHTDWVAVDSHPGGLNCRMDDRYEIFDASRPNDIYNWPVDRALTWGRRFETLPSMAGGVFYDDRGNAWLFVLFNQNPNQPEGCFVRANADSVRPIDR
ncbi:hypothetical protein CKA32_000751 [Geitlerinema sp. FC II]|uniref:hypothetical protein n=1 Tax=Baaleninema simplex TaxID=2862350 RepID=UPI0003457D30|nr:hypothetical protein [Baaleninema simplex]PPT06023.1 hypothetical protein CKA32_000751 [Geitlerinema sp. FC II]